MISWYLSVWLHLVWSSLAPTMLLQVALFHCLWLSSFHCRYVPHFVYPFICQWTLGLLPCLGYCKQCCYEHWKSESEVAQSCPTLRDPMDCCPPGSSIHGIFQARVLEWVAISLSRRSSQHRDWTQVSRIVGRHFTVWATREVYEHWGCMYLFKLEFLYFLNICSGVGLQDHRVALFLVFWETFILFSMVAAPIYVPSWFLIFINQMV